MTGKNVLLMVLDGWGVNKKKEGNAILAAKAPFYHRLLAEYPSTELSASGESVGLPDGQMGNSEVGHLNLGAGRIVYQDSTRISKAIREGDFFKNPVLLSAMDAAAKTEASLHLMGLLSDGGVHSRLDHIYAMCDMAAARGVRRLFFHAFLDGRDTPPSSALRYVKDLEQHFARTGVGKIATVSGRYYAMDRDKRWERIQKAYEALVLAEGIRKYSAVEAIEQSYQHERTDEFMLPTVILDSQTNKPLAPIRTGDAVIFCNFRSDRAREITRALTDPEFQGFRRLNVPRLSAFVCLTAYDETFNLPVAFAPQRLTNILGEVVSKNDIRQLRIAETEKYAHVTFFFNGGEEPPFPREDRILVPSPRDVATYDKKPAMSAREITDKLVEQITSRQYGFILVNYANPDMVGHTGIVEAAIKAVEVLDECLERVLKAAWETDMTVLITADHGNIEVMFDPVSGQPHTAHTTDPVPCILVRKGAQLRSGGVLADIAPTVLELMGLEIPKEMTGRSLLASAS
ncbi:MAG TPA: 2,3-bisphosphoglycerate-independent phosphoglycerate mutase [Nitrospirota bacterium]|nr:2,3-bisphosphoglycerate-independent phosphoglycerate mutase [Nitrospirota bacterium]